MPAELRGVVGQINMLCLPGRHTGHVAGNDQRRQGCGDAGTMIPVYSTSSVTSSASAKIGPEKVAGANTHADFDGLL